MNNRPDHLFHEGYNAGLNSVAPATSFELSMKHAEYALGYVAGYAFAQSVRHASPQVWAWEVGELGRQYSIPLKRLEQLVDADEDEASQLLDAIRQTYREGVDDEESFDADDH